MWMCEVDEVAEARECRVLIVATLELTGRLTPLCKVFCSEKKCVLYGDSSSHVIHVVLNSRFTIYALFFCN